MAPRKQSLKISRRGLSRPSMARIHQMHRSLSKGEYPNFRKLAKKLGVSEKTVQRDLDLMRDRMELPIEYSQTHFGFYYREPVVDIPGLELTEGEIVALFIARQALGQYAGTPFASALTSACARLEQELHNRVSLNLHELDTMLSFRSVGENPAEMESFRLVNRAVMDSVELTFDYHKINGSGFEARRVQPLHLGCHENQWYLWAFDVQRTAMRTFALSRLKNPVVTKKKFKRPAKFTIEKHLDGSFGVFRGDSEYRIRIWFDSFASRYVREKKWHRSQKLTELKDGETELAVKLNSLQEISRWVLSWGKHARVLEPQALIEELADVAKSLTEFYSTTAVA
jgi:proteasome accessory factor B